VAQACPQDPNVLFALLHSMDVKTKCYVEANNNPKILASQTIIIMMQCTPNNLKGLIGSSLDFLSKLWQL
jgi:hypothetical protein